MADSDYHGNDETEDTPVIEASASVVTNPSDDQPYYLSDTSSDMQASGLHVQPASSSLRLMPLSQEWKLKVFLMKLAKDITDDELDDMKLLMKGEWGMGKRALSEIKTVKQFFSHMMDIDFVDQFNLLYLQSLIWHIDRKDLHAQIVSFAREYNACPLHFFLPDKKPRNGYVYADFHIGGQLETTSKQDLEILRTNIAERLCVPPKFIFIKGIEPLHSLIITLMVPKSAVFALFELSEIEKSTLQSLRVDSFGVGDRRVKLADLKFEKAATLSEKEEIQRMLEKKEFLTTELDRSQARLIERSKALSSSQEELAKVKVTTDQLKMANDRAMMILATLVYQDLALNSGPVDSLCRLSISTYFQFCLKQFRSQFPEAAKHIGDLLDANALVVRKTERDLLRNYVERLQIHQLALEHRCQTVQPAYRLADFLFQRPSVSVQQQFISTKSQTRVSRPTTLMATDNQDKTAPTRKKLFDRRAEKKSALHPFSSALKEISLKLKDTHKEKLIGNICFNKIEQMEISKHPEKFLQILFENEMGEIPADPCEHVLKKLGITGDKDLRMSASKLLLKRQTDLKLEKDTSGPSGHKNTSSVFCKSFYKYPTPERPTNPSLDLGQTPHGTQQMEQRGGKSGEAEIHGIHRSASESALRHHDSDEGMHEKLDRVLSEIELLKMMIQKQHIYQSPVGAKGYLFPMTSPTDFRGSMPEY